MRVLLGPTIHQISAAHAQLLCEPGLLPGVDRWPFETGLRRAFDFAGGVCLVAAVASWLSGERYVHTEPMARRQARLRRRRAHAMRRGSPHRPYR